jgi:glycosyltransferase involved in cell wall biosynthesis
MCLPSIYEGLPIVLLEAIAVGCIPICAPAGGCVNVIQNGINGFLSTSSNEEDYYQVVKQFLSLNATELELFKLQCKASFSIYDIKICSQKHLKYYK